MRKPFAGAMLSLLAVLVFSSVTMAQMAQPQSPKSQGDEPRSPWKFYPRDNVVGDGGPARSMISPGPGLDPGRAPQFPEEQRRRSPS